MTIAVPQHTRRTGAATSKQRLRLWLRLLRASRAIEAELRDRLRRSFRVTLPQFDVMAALARRAEGMGMTELSRYLMVSNGNVTGIIDRLVGDDLVARAAIAGDRRSVRVKLTAKGSAQFAAMAVEHEGWVDELLSRFDKAEAEMLIAHLDGLSASLREKGTCT